MTFRLGDIVPSGALPELTSVQRNCLKKTHYKSKAAAEAAIRASKKRAETCMAGDTLEPYQCVRCFGWLVGHGKKGR